MRNSQSLAAVPAALLLLLLPAPAQPEATPGWEEIERLVSEQKLEAAAAAVEGVLARALREADDAEQARALIERARLRSALHGYETAVRELREASWPEDPLERAVLELYYARSLVDYLHTYGWEIGRRERVASDDEVDLARWTRDQLYAEARAAFARAYAARVALGRHPLEDWSRELAPGTYPERIRGTLRDAVSYLYVELLANSSFWRAQQSNELYQLDLEALLELPGRRSAEPGDPDLHPLRALARVLGDLERWHQDAGRREAALEARLERLRRLHTALTSADDRARLRADLAKRLPASRALPWWSEGMATLAQFEREHDDAWSLRRARSLALEGAQAYPDSPGGRRCLSIARSIEAPTYQLTAMTADGMGRRSFQISHRNLGRLWLRAYRTDLRDQVRGSRDYNLLPGYREIPGLLERTPDAQWSVDLPDTPDWNTHKSFVTAPLSTPGLYVVVASARADFASEENQLQAVNIVLSDLVLVTRQIDGGIEVTAHSGESGELRSGARIALYRADYRGGHREVGSRTTGRDGIARFAWTEDRERRGHFLLGSHGADVALWGPSLHFYRDRRETRIRSSLLYTDRSAYRPLQTIHWKVVAYAGDTGNGRFETSADESVTVSLLDTNGQTVDSLTLSTNEFGSASGEFRIPAGRLLGGWQLQSSLGGSTRIRVEEYKRPTFEVELGDAESALRLNRPATLEGEVRYYFGLPLVRGEVRWRVQRDPELPWWWRHWGGLDASGVAQSQTIASGTAELDAEGRFRIRFTPEADERKRDDVPLRYRYTLTVDVTDEGGETRSASRSFPLGFVSVEARISSAQSFFREGAGGLLEIVRSSLDGTPRAGAGEWRLLALEQPDRTLLPAEQPLPAPREADGEPPFRTPGDRLRPRWDPGLGTRAELRTFREGPELARGEVAHDAEGRAEVELPASLAAGAYRLVYQTEDDFGERFSTSHELIVAGEAHIPLALPLVLLAERPSVSVGERARFLVHSGLPDQRMLLEIWRSGRRVERRELRSGESPSVVEIPIDPSERGGFGVTLTAIRDHQLLSRSQSLFVPWEDRELELSFQTFRDRLRPGSHETWRVAVHGPDEAALGAGAAELLAYMYDRSLDVFAAHSPPSPLSVYPNRTASVAARAALGAGWPAWTSNNGFGSVPAPPALVPSHLVGYPGYAIGGLGGRKFSRVRRMAAASEVGDFAAKERSNGALDALSEHDAKPASAPPPAAPDEKTLRSDFSETAFWQPHLRSGADGSFTIEFDVPDSVTEWNVWVHALTRDLRGGAIHERVETAKELMVRPYLPRFLREGDRAEIEVVVNNASEAALEGTLELSIFDPQTENSLTEAFGVDEPRRRFRVAGGGGTSLRFGVRVPRGPGPVAFKVVASSGAFSDGELRALPVLPGRVHLAQSRFVTLRGAEQRELFFEDLARDDDPTRTHDSLVVSVDAQLFYGVLEALPYLVRYPYECTEQVLNRFLSTGIVSSIFERYPGVARMARELAARETRLVAWDGPDANRKMALEELPWLVEAKGGREPAEDLIAVLDPKIAAAERAAALAVLGEAQTSLGAFPWFPGGPPSPYMTVYLLYGFSKALEFDVEIPKDVTVRAWSYLHRHYVDEHVAHMLDDDCCWEFITFLNYVLSRYPDDSWTGGVFSDEERARMLDFSFAHWKEHSPYLKAYLALTLARSGRAADAHLVLDSILDSAKTTRDEGTFWAPEDRSWLWYNDTVETQATLLHTMLELAPDDERTDGLVQWLFLNKKLNHWKSTRATAEVIYSLVHYLEREGALGASESVTVATDSTTTVLRFDPERYTGKAQVVVPGRAVRPESARVYVSKTGPGFAFASATWHFSTEQLPPAARGDLLEVERSYFLRVHDGREWTLQPIDETTRLAPGDEVEVQLRVRARHAAEYVHLRDPRPAGLEPAVTRSGHHYETGVRWYQETRDSATSFFFESLPAGEFTLRHRLRANLAGEFRVSPATLQSMYAPEFTAYSSGSVVSVRPR